MALEDYNCILCSHIIEESLPHLFLAPFAAQCWNTLYLQTRGLIDWFDILDSFRRRQLAVPFFLKILIGMSWAILFVRNDHIFKHRHVSLGRRKKIFKDEFVGLRPSLSSWLDKIMCNSPHFLCVIV